MDNLIANQVGNVGYHPILTGLNEPVVVQLSNVGLDDNHLLRDHAQQCLQWEALLRIALAINRWQKFIQSVRIFIY